MTMHFTPFVMQTVDGRFAAYFHVHTPGRAGSTPRGWRVLSHYREAYDEAVRLAEAAKARAGK